MAAGRRGQLQLMVDNTGLLTDTLVRVFEFNPFRLEPRQEPEAPELEKESYVYAPEPAHPSQTAYYLEVPKDHWEILFQKKARNSGTSIFVSVSLVKDIIDGEDRDWVEKDTFQIGMNAEAEKAWLLNPKPLSAPEVQLNHLVIKVRNSLGVTSDERLHINENGSAAIFWQKWIKTKFSMKGMGGKPPRCSNFALTEPLNIVPITENDVIRKALRDCVRLVNEENDPTQSNKGNLAKGRLRLSIKEPDASKYMLMSVDPFGIFRTYIHLTDWDAWMTHVGHKDHSKPNSLRDFIVTGNETLDKCFEGITKEYEKLHQSQKEWQDIPDPKTVTRKQKAGTLSRRFIAHFSSRHTIDVRDNGVGMYVYLEAQKILDAASKRAGEDTQKTVMGNVSAPDIAASLDWAKEMVSFTNAEWLHLAGFAYGGFMMTGDTSGWSTSQNPHNLVFGTSETNSLMTRYESAWQTFLLYEYELQKMNNIIQLIDSKKRNARAMPKILSADGQLLIRTNVPESDLEYDYYDSTAARKYTRKTFPLWAEQQTEDQKQDFRQVPQTQLSGENMRKAAEEYFFIAHTIEYTLLYEHVSHMLKKPTFQQTVHFFPFSRPLLHKLETELDRKLMTHLYKSAKRDLVGDFKELGSITFPRNKNLKNKKQTKASGSKLGAKKRRKAVASMNRKQANTKEEEKYFDFEGYGDFSELILGLDLGDLGDFESFQDMAMITDFGQFGRAVSVEDGEDIVAEKVESDPMEEQIGKVSIFDEIAIFKAKGKKDQEKPWGFFKV